MKIEDGDLVPYLVKVRSSNPRLVGKTLVDPKAVARTYTVVVLSLVAPDDMGSKPECLETFCEEVRWLDPSLTVVDVEMMVWARHPRIVYLDDSAERIKEFMGWKP